MDHGSSRTRATSSIVAPIRNGHPPTAPTGLKGGVERTAAHLMTDVESSSRQPSGHGITLMSETVPRR